MFNAVIVVTDVLLNISTYHLVTIQLVKWSPGLTLNCHLVDFHSGHKQVVGSLYEKEMVDDITTYSNVCITHQLASL